jgi:hypothetical protein
MDLHLVCSGQFNHLLQIFHAPATRTNTSDITSSPPKFEQITADAAIGSGRHVFTTSGTLMPIRGGASIDYPLVPCQLFQTPHFDDLPARVLS